jgi:uncharacterized membrane protein YuzA (DUF378 family)
MDSNKLIHSLALLLAGIGALNWGLAIFANFDLVTAIAGGSASYSASTIGQVVYALVALAGLYTLYMFYQSLSK